MKYIVTILLFFVSVACFGQRNVGENSRDLDIALVELDTAFLNQYLHDELSYGHSNGWIESKRDVIEHLLSGKLRYVSIRSKELSRQETGTVTIVRAESNTRYVLDGKEGELKLHVLQVWLQNGYKWQLLSRQSTKLN